MTAEALPDPADSPRLPGHGPAGLRERKKVATRQALGEAAMRLAVERGLDKVLVEDIADAAGVSARTFNNYFASKYEAICALQQDRALRIGDELRARPAGEPLWESVTQAVLSQFGPADRAPDKDWIAGIRLVVSSPALRGEYLKVAGHGAVSPGRGDRRARRGPRWRPTCSRGSWPARSRPRCRPRWNAGCTPTRRCALAPLIRRALRQFAEGMREVLPAEAADAG